MKTKGFVKLGFLGLMTVLMAACAPEDQRLKSQNAMASLSEAPSESIIGGTDVSNAASFASTIVGLYNLRDSSLCTGSIIAETYVVTAAHCAPEYAADLVVFFGTNIETATVTRRVDKIKLTSTWGSRFQESTDWGDVAVLHLTKKIPLGYKVAKLLPESFVLKKGQAVLLSGYGISNGVTKEGSGILRSTIVQIENPIHGKTEVAVNQTGGHGACHGDSGGPAFVKIGSEFFLFGVTSRGYLDAKDDCSQFAIYSNLLKYKSLLSVASIR